VDSAHQQELPLRTIPFTDVHRGVHGAFQEASYTEAGKFVAHQAVLATITYRLRTYRSDDVAFIPPDRFRKRKSTCANQADGGTDKGSDGAFAHWVLLHVANLISGRREHRKPDWRVFEQHRLC
jgi:hypothetical protein